MSFPSLFNTALIRILLYRLPKAFYQHTPNNTCVEFQYDLQTSVGREALLIVSISIHVKISEDEIQEDAFGNYMGYTFHFPTSSPTRFDFANPVKSASPKLCLNK